MTMSIKEMADKYSGSGFNDYFALKDDGDTAKVRFMFKGDEEGEKGFTGVPVHRKNIDGYQRKIMCTEEPDCPLCKSGDRPSFRLFMQLLDYRDDEEGELKTWERGTTFVGTIFSHIEKYYPMYERKFEIQRNGKKGDQRTTYTLFAEDKDNEFKSVEDLPELEDTIAPKGKVLELTHAQMNEVLNGTFSLSKDSVEKADKKRDKTSPF